MRHMLALALSRPASPRPPPASARAKTSRISRCQCRTHVRLRSRQPSVFVSAWNVTSLDFRVYRINDPRRILQAHSKIRTSSADASPRPPREPTLLERFHEWKRGCAPASAATSAASSPNRPARISRACPQQAPAGHRDQGNPLRRSAAAESAATGALFPPARPEPKRDGSRRPSPSTVNEKGVYLVEAVHKDLRAYTILMVSDIAMITKTGKGRIVNLRRRSQHRRADRRRNGLVSTGRDKNSAAPKPTTDGIAAFRLRRQARRRRPRRRSRLANASDDFAVNTLPATPSAVNREDRMTGYIYTDRPVYRPGHTVHFKGILRLRTAAGYEVPAGKIVSVEIQDPDQKPVYQQDAHDHRQWARFTTISLCPPPPRSATYTIEIKSGEAEATATSRCEEYKKPEYEVRVTPAKPRVLQGERCRPPSMPATISASRSTAPR